jgi:hypothetical protein
LYSFRKLLDRNKTCYIPLVCAKDEVTKCDSVIQQQGENLPRDCPRSTPKTTRNLIHPYLLTYSNHRVGVVPHNHPRKQKKRKKPKSMVQPNVMLYSGTGNRTPSPADHRLESYNSRSLKTRYVNRYTIPDDRCSFTGCGVLCLVWGTES